MSFKPQTRREVNSIIPDDLRLFEPGDIKIVFDYLEKTFHLSKNWQVEFRKELLKVERGMTEPEFFFRYALQHIDPALQRLLRRKDSVIFALTRYLIKDRLQEKKREQQHAPSYYKNGEWKTNSSR